MYPLSALRAVVLLVAMALLMAACGDSDDGAATTLDSAASATSEAPSEDTAGAEASTPPASAVTLTLITHDSFAVTAGLFDAFTDETGIAVEQVVGGDAGEMVSKAVLTAGEPEGDVMFGVDNTFLQRALNGDVFAPYESALLDNVDDNYELDAGEYRVTPMDVGDVCVNWRTDSLPNGEAPQSLDDLAKVEYASSFVTQNPETSSPGFAFLLATIAEYGDGWEDYWQQLRDGGVKITSGWTEAYQEDFAVGGERSLVTSYASSPVAEVLYSEEAIDESPTGVLADSCFRQIEFAGVLAGTDHPDEAGQLVDFMLSDTFQNDIPLNMFVAPVSDTATVPAEFGDHVVAVDSPYSLTPAEIEANRSEWTDRWTDIVLR
jgi:thiamine transport system substrate-binding protein